MVVMTLGKTIARRGSRSRKADITKFEMTKVDVRIPPDFNEALERLAAKAKPEFTDSDGRPFNFSKHVREAIKEYLLKHGELKS